MINAKLLTFDTLTDMIIAIIFCALILIAVGIFVGYCLAAFK